MPSLNLQLIVPGVNGQSLEPVLKNVVEAIKLELGSKLWNHVVALHAQETMLSFRCAIQTAVLVRCKCEPNVI